VRWMRMITRIMEVITYPSTSNEKNGRLFDSVMEYN
jgi:hypothetical protein